jgi:hypothetical protein
MVGKQTLFTIWPRTHWRHNCDGKKEMNLGYADKKSTSQLFLTYCVFLMK